MADARLASQGHQQVADERHVEHLFDDDAPQRRGHLHVRARHEAVQRAQVDWDGRVLQLNGLLERQVQIRRGVERPKLAEQGLAQEGEPVGSSGPGADDHAGVIQEVETAYTTSTVTIVEVPGNHVTMMRAPDVQELARR
jgi:hypothetical protein